MTTGGVPGRAVLAIGAIAAVVAATGTLRGVASASSLLEGIEAGATRWAPEVTSATVKAKPGNGTGTVRVRTGAKTVILKVKQGEARELGARRVKIATDALSNKYLSGTEIDFVSSVTGCAPSPW